MCETGVRHVYKGGVYHTTPSVFQRLDDEGITDADTLTFYPYRATFDFVCFFDGEDLPANSDRVQWIARHVPLSVSVASNVPGHEPPRCYVTDGDSDKLVDTMMRGLSAISDTAFDMLIQSYDNVLNELEVRKEAWDEAERKALKADESKQEDHDEEVEMEAEGRKEGTCLFDINNHNTEYTTVKLCRETPTKAQSVPLSREPSMCHNT